jgi:hypothetical protein
LTATAAAGSAAIDLSWGVSANAEQYIIQRSLPDTGSGYDWSDIATNTGALANTYPDTNVPFNATYAYQIIATNDVANSLPGNVATATTVPASPDPLIATAVSFTGINLSWSDVAGETGFSVERNGVVIDSATAGTLNFSDSNLSPGTSYTYQVRAESDAGFSGYTAARSATTQGTTKFLNQRFDGDGCGCEYGG